MIHGLAGVEIFHSLAEDIGVGYGPVVFHLVLVSFFFEC